MNDRVKLNVFYPYPVKKVWQALTDSRILSIWMMNNDFQPRLGHKFKFESESLPGIKTVIHCEVVELEKPKRLSYTWQNEVTGEPSLVIWTLTTVEGGTQLQLKHLQTGYATTMVCDRSRNFREIGIRPGLFLGDEQPIANFHRQMPQASSHQVAIDELNYLCDRQNFKEDWDYRLNQLLEVLTR